MTPDSIQAMLADPRIDPTEWVGKALMNWVKSNPGVVLKDADARKYLFAGMEADDVHTLSQGVVGIYKAEPDGELVRTFVEGLNKLNESARHAYSLEYNTSNCIRSFQHSIADEVSIDHLVNIKHPGSDSYNPNDAFISLLKPRHAKKLIMNRNPEWGYNQMDKVIQLIPSDELLDFATTSVLPNLLSEEQQQQRRHNDNVYNACSTIKLFFKYLPKSDATAWLNWLEKTDFKNLWHGSDRVSKSKSYSEKWSLDETVCPCGAMHTTKSGCTLHRRSCGYGEDYISIENAARVLASAYVKNSCHKCGRTCSTNSGLTLHTKSCTSKAHELVAAMRKKDEEEKDDNKSENPVSR